MLETEMKRLNDNIEKLISVMQSTATPTTSTTTPVSVESPQEEGQKDKGYTTDDIKSMALAISRKDRSKQKDIKAKLADHGAKIATDLSGDDLQAVGAWLSDLKSEIGA